MIKFAANDQRPIDPHLLECDARDLVAMKDRLVALAADCRAMNKEPRAALTVFALNIAAARIEDLVEDFRAPIAGLRHIAESERAARG